MLVSAMQTNLSRDVMLSEKRAFFEGAVLIVCAPNGSRPKGHRFGHDGISSIVFTSAIWRELPEEFDNGSTVCGRSNAANSQGCGRTS